MDVMSLQMKHSDKKFKAVKIGNLKDELFIIKRMSAIERIIFQNWFSRWDEILFFLYHATQ